MPDTQPRATEPTGTPADGESPDRIDAFVSLDLETTGLDVETDTIIEVGVVRFGRAGIEERWETLVNPGQPIPPEVQELTGIDDIAVASAPAAPGVMAQLAEFIGDLPIVGQNIQFDLNFLEAEDLIPRGASYDTWELASILLPRADRLNLATLAEALGVEMPVAHRALADAVGAAEVFIELLQRLEALPRSLLLELHSFATRAQWPAARLIEDALAHGGGRDALAGIDEEEAAAIVAALPLPPVAEAPPALVPADHNEPLTDADIDALFTELANRTDLMPGFERRHGQEEMAAAFATILGHGGELAVEAGTGTGKSLAYLLPALLHAARNDDRVVISTHTRNLQDQLAEREIPIAAPIVEAVAEIDEGALRTTVLKGRSNYLCLERWAQVRADISPRSEAEARLFGRIATWLPGTETGDLSELYMTSAEEPAWAQVSAGDTDCLSRRCPYVRDGSCFLLRARQRAAAAHVVVVNHALLLASAVSGSQAMPPFRHLVVDEAHRLEGVATQQYTRSWSINELRDLLDDLGTADRHGNPGLTRRLVRGSGEADLLLSPTAGLQALGDDLGASVRSLRDEMTPAANALRAFARNFDDGSNGRTEVSLTHAKRSSPEWEAVEEAGTHLDVALLLMRERLGTIGDALTSLGGDDPDDPLGLDVARAFDRTEVLRHAIRESVLTVARDQIVWVALGEGDVRVSLAPLDVGPPLVEDLFGERDSVLVTSASLKAGDSFSHSLGPLGLQAADQLDVPSPFDYRRQALVILVEDMPEPGMPGYHVAIEDVLHDAAIAADGRTLGLFTSHAAVRQAQAELKPRLAEAEIRVLAQRLDGSPGRLLRMLMDQPRTLLLGTAAFWEGVDVPGDALSQIAIARLPFPVPSDPIYAGRAGQFEDPFGEYALPGALLRFKQGFGRLIRGPQDRGVLLVLDARIHRRRYGARFIAALPELEVRTLHSRDVPAAVAEWLRP